MDPSGASSNTPYVRLPSSINLRRSPALRRHEFSVPRGSLRVSRATGEGLPGREQRTVRSTISEWMAAGALPAVVAALGMRLAVQAVRMQTRVLHVVAVGARVHRRRLLVAREPTAARVQRWLAESVSAEDAAPRTRLRGAAAGRELEARYRRGALDAARIIDWLAASAHLRDVRKAGEAARSFARIFAQDLSIPFWTLANQLSCINRETLRLSRVRLDVLCMSIHRRLCSQLLSGARGSQTSIYLYTDSSPQWRGSELFASSIEVYDCGEEYLSRRLLPVVALDKGLFDGIGKTLALLWQLWLCCGPGWVAMKRACRRVRAIVSDMGTERKVVNQPDLMAEFFWLIQYPVTERELLLEPVGDFLFPGAAQVPGWRHSVDLLLQRSLSSLVWFPAWLDKLKARCKRASLPWHCVDSPGAMAFQSCAPCGLGGLRKCRFSARASLRESAPTQLRAGG